MSGFFTGLFGRVFGAEDKSSDVLPDDGGFAQFAKQYARELAEEAERGQDFSKVVGEDVLSVQQGRKGARVYILDTTDFKKVLVPELRASVRPICEGILRRHCGEKGTGFMEVKSVFVFFLRRSDPDVEYNDALNLIDEIGARLLGKRYISGEKRPDIGLAQVPCSSLFKPSGEFNYRKAKRATKLVRDANVRGPAAVDLKSQKVTKLESKTLQSSNLSGVKQVDPHWKKFRASSKIEEVPASPVKSDVMKPLKKVAPVPSPTPKKDVAPPKSDVVKSQPTEMKTVPSDIDAMELTLLFRPAWQVEAEEINMFSGLAFRKRGDDILAGQEVYGGTQDPSQILEIDQILAKQAATHIEQTTQVWKKRIVLPFHVASLSRPQQDQGPLSALQALKRKFRKNIWIEIVGVDPSRMVQQVTDVMACQNEFFQYFGLRLSADQLSTGELEAGPLQFLSCDMEELSAGSLDQNLAALQTMASAQKMVTCFWGAKNRKSIAMAKAHKVSYISGRRIGPQSVKIGKVESLSVAKLLKR